MKVSGQTVNYQQFSGCAGVGQDEVRRSAWPPLLTSRDLARVFGTTRQTIGNWTRSGRLEGFRVGRQWRFETWRVVRLLSEAVQRSRGAEDRPAIAAPLASGTASRFRRQRQSRGRFHSLGAQSTRRRGKGGHDARHA